MTLLEIKEHNIQYFRTDTMDVGTCLTPSGDIRVWNKIIASDVHVSDHGYYLPCTKWGVDVSIYYDYCRDSMLKPNKKYFGKDTIIDRMRLSEALNGNTEYSHLLLKDK